MTIIHMETDIVRNLTDQFTQTTEALQSNGQTLISSVRFMDWMGPSRDEFVNETESLLRKLQDQLEQGKNLFQRVEKEVVEWEDSARQFGSDGNGSHIFSPTFRLPETGDGVSYRQEAENRVGIKLPWENDAYYEWKIMREEAFLNWFNEHTDDYVDENSRSNILIPPLIILTNIGRFIGNTGNWAVKWLEQVKGDWNPILEKWMKDNPEPKYWWNE